MNKSMAETLQSLKTLPFKDAVNLLVTDSNTFDCALKCGDHLVKIIQRRESKNKNKNPDKQNKIPFEIAIAIYDLQHLQELFNAALPQINARKDSEAADKAIDEIMLTIPK